MIRARKSLGQNFLVDPNIQRKIVDALEVRAGDEVVEIGPGLGALTQHLAGAARRLVLVELDDRLVERLRERFAGEPDVEIVHADVLDLDLAELSEDPAAAKVVGNIPYNITTPLIFWLLERSPRPQAAVLMVQKEVADRILAPPGDKQYGALSVGVRSVADAERLFNVSRNAFRPAPEVMSSVIRLTPHRPPRLEPAEEADLRALTRATFAWRRKQLQKTLRSGPGYGLDAGEVERIEAETGLDLQARPETLSPEDFIRLARALRAAGYPVE